MLTATSVLLTVLPLTLGAQSPSTFDLVRRGIVRVGEEITAEDRRWLGTGFIVDERCTFLTAKHVIATARRDRIVIRFQLPGRLNTSRTLAARVLFEEPNTDLARGGPHRLDS